MKLAPLITSARLGPPVTAVVGDIDVMTVVGGTTSNGTALDCLPSPLRTTTWRIPTAALKEPGTVAFKLRELTKVVATSVPSISTTAPELKFRPDTNSGNVPLPTMTNLGM